MVEDAEQGDAGNFVPLEWPGDIMTCVLPLFAVTETQAKFVGSSFMFRDRLVTARHVATELEELVNKSYGVKAIACAIVLTPDGRSWRCRVPAIEAASDHYANSDVALCTIDIPDDLAAGYNLVSLDVSRDWVNEGTEVVAFGHTGIDRMIDLNDAGTLAEVLGLVRMEAVVTGSFTESMHIKAPCFEMAGPLPGGTSGGPIFELDTGRVVGVCSYAATPNSQLERPRSFGTMTRNLFDEPKALPQSGWLP
jgi:hypothetical protein